MGLSGCDTGADGPLALRPSSAPVIVTALELRGAVVPAQLSGITQARLHMAGYDLCQELYKAAYDMSFYFEDYEAEQYTDLASQYLVLPREKEDAFLL